MATCPRLHPQRSFCRRAIQYCDNDKTTGGQFFPKTTTTQQAEPFNFAATKIGIGRVTVVATTAAGGPFYFAAKKNRIRRGIVAATTDAGGPFYFAAKKNSIRRGNVAAMTFRRRAILLADTMALL